MKIANDIRFLGSGPRARYGELILPEEMNSGSSIMPGKVNPTQSEAVTMVCVKLLQSQRIIFYGWPAWSLLELKCFKPLIAHNILQSIDLLLIVQKFSILYSKGLKAE